VTDDAAMIPVQPGTQHESRTALGLGSEQLREPGDHRGAEQREASLGLRVRAGDRLMDWESSSSSLVSVGVPW